MKRVVMVSTIMAACMFFLTVPILKAQPIDYCEGNFDNDYDVDGTDASLFKADFGRSSMQNPCPVCEAGVVWCQYP